MTVTKEKLSTAAQSESTAMSPDAIPAKYISAVSHDQFDADEQPYAYSCTPRLLYDSHADCMQDSFAFQQRRACGTRFPGGGHYDETDRAKMNDGLLAPLKLTTYRNSIIIIITVIIKCCSILICIQCQLTVRLLC